MVKGSRQSSSIDNSGALFLGLGPFFLLLRLATLWFGSIFIAIPLQATALHAPRFSSFSCSGENLGAVCRLGFDMDSCDESLAPFHDLQVLCEMSATWKNAWNHERVEGFGTAADSALDFRGSVVCTAVACDSWGHGKVGSLISREANFWPAYPVPSLCGLRLRRGMGSFLFSSVAFHVNKFHLIQRKRKIRQLHLETSARDSGQCGPHPQYTRSMMVLVADLVQPVDLNALRPTFYLVLFWQVEAGGQRAQWSGGKAQRNCINGHCKARNNSSVCGSGKAKDKPQPSASSGAFGGVIVGLISLNFGKTYACQNCDSGRSNCRMCQQCESWCRDFDGPRATNTCWRTSLLTSGVRALTRYETRAHALGGRRIQPGAG